MKKIALWSLYDFANSFMGIVLIFYFPLILIERGGAELWIGVSSSIATALLLMFLPRLGHWIDATGNVRLVIASGTIVSALILCAIAYTFVLLPPSQTATVVALVLFGLFYIGFETAITAYTSLLRSITRASSSATISGYGYACGQMGNVVGVLLANVCVGSGVLIVGVTGKPLGLLFGGVVGLIIALPFLYSLPKRTETNVSEAFSYRVMVSTIRGDRRLFLFLIGMALLYDTILTFQLYLTSYTKIVLGFTDQLTVYAGALALACGMVSAALSGMYATYLGSASRALMWSALFYAGCAFVVSVVPAEHIRVLILIALCGVAYGLVFSLGRAVYAYITPEREQNTYFGIFTVFERMAAVVGPLAWTVTFLLATPYGNEVQYRFSVFILACIALAGFFVLRVFNHSHEKSTPN